jgi:sugar (pentulose or hexulose) kinase
MSEDVSLSPQPRSIKPFASPRIGWAEQDPRDWWRACGIAVHKALGQGRLRGDQISCVGLSGQMHGAVLLDEQASVVPACADLVRCQDRKLARDGKGICGVSPRISRDEVHPKMMAILN